MRAGERATREPGEEIHGRGIASGRSVSVADGSSLIERNAPSLARAVPVDADAGAPARGVLSEQPPPGVLRRGLE